MLTNVLYSDSRGIFKTLVHTNAVSLKRMSKSNASLLMSSRSEEERKANRKNDNISLSFFCLIKGIHNKRDIFNSTGNYICR